MTPLELSTEDFRRLALWIQERDNALGDEQMDRDSASGKLDALFAEADTLPHKDWPRAE